ncbi:hypothetical protein [Sorangium cellulosum]|uniref:hypothetical protein n=1 Tax=Sorangium cellulosum TaxID=56 RepID=UPI0011DD438D|nr:hypothetical protein [Sorangium cellulosum]
MKGWSCYPIWGIELADNAIGLEKPIFGDATLVTRAYVQTFAPADPVAASMLSGGGVRQALDKSSFAGSAPIERLIDIPPGAFIAVRRSKPEDAVRYAESVRALLTATSVLTSGQGKGFAMTPLPLHWAAVPSYVRLNQAGQLQIDYHMVVNNFIHLQPIRVTHKQLRDSWNSGSTIQGSWTISREHALSKALIGDWGSLSPLRRRVRGAACTLARAMESTDPTLSTLFTVVALESLLKEGASGFAEMAELAACIFEGPNGPADIARLFGNRHKVAHEAISPAGTADHAKEIFAAWALVFLAAMSAEALTSPAQLLEHLRGRVLARRIAKRLRENGRTDLAAEVENEAKQLPKKGPTS